MDEKNQKFPQLNNPEPAEENLDLDAIMKEFSSEEEAPAEEAFQSVPQEFPEAEALFEGSGEPADEDVLEEYLRETPAQEEHPADPAMEETIRIELAPVKEKASEMGDTIRLDNVVKAVKEQLPEEPEQPVALDEPEEIRIAPPTLPKKEEPYSETWEPEYDQPIGENW